MALLGKMLPLMALAGVGVTQKDKIEVVGTQIIDMVQVVVTKHELTTIRTAVMNENAAGNLKEVRQDFSEFVRQVVHSDNKDVTRDFWDNRYRYEEDKETIYLASDGPDGERNTDDDIVVSIPRF